MSIVELPEGISWHPGIQRWRADVKNGKKYIYLGSGETIAEAAELYRERAPAVLAKLAKEHIQAEIQS